MSGYSFEYCAALVEVINRRGEAFEVDLCRSGAIEVLLPDPVPEGYSVHATPFWDDTPGLPVQVMDSEGRAVASFELPFTKTDDISRDASEFMRLCSLIPEILWPK